MLVSQRVHGFKRRLILWLVTKSCTRQGTYERYRWNTVNNGKTHLPTGAGFLPSAVWRWICKRHILSFGEHMIKLMGFPSISSLMFTGLHSLVRTTWLQAGALLHFFFEAGIVRIDSITFLPHEWDTSCKLLPVPLIMILYVCPKCDPNMMRTTRNKDCSQWFW